MSFIGRARMLYDPRRWHPFKDAQGIVHHAKRLTKREARYLFRLADMVTTLVSCGQCLSPAGKWCVSKLGMLMSNHSRRVREARQLVKRDYEPLFDQMFQPLCTVDTDYKYVVLVPADGHEVDCMACLVISTTAYAGCP